MNYSRLFLPLVPKKYKIVLRTAQPKKYKECMNENFNSKINFKNWQVHFCELDEFKLIEMLNLVENAKYQKNIIKYTECVNQSKRVYNFKEFDDYLIKVYHFNSSKRRLMVQFNSSKKSNGLLNELCNYRKIFLRDSSHVGIKNIYAFGRYYRFGILQSELIIMDYVKHEMLLADYIKINKSNIPKMSQVIQSYVQLIVDFYKKGILHSDLHAENILIKELSPMRIKAIDFENCIFDKNKSLISILHNLNCLYNFSFRNTLTQDLYIGEAIKYLKLHFPKVNFDFFGEMLLDLLKSDLLKSRSNRRVFNKNIDTLEMILLTEDRNMIPIQLVK